MHNEDWFSNFKKTEDYAAFERNPIAYFSAEYALDSALPTYAGGLGVLAGDYVREAGGWGFPLIAVGLNYKNAQHSVVRVGDEALQNEALTHLSLVVDENKIPVLISLPIEGRIVHAKAYVWNENGTNVYLLDTDVEENTPEDRNITQQLYVEDRTLRLKQEILLGIGGFRLLKRLGHHPSVYHLNEGHSAFLGLELAHHEMEHRHVDFSTACDYAKKHVLFTNHTLVPAGQEQFGADVVTRLLSHYAEELGVPLALIVELGQTQHEGAFSMTTLAFRFASKINAVSKLHAEKAHLLWPEHEMENVTNGISLVRWDKVGSDAPQDLWRIHQDNKRALLEYIFQITGEKWDEQVLLVGWARRTVDYKQPLVFFSDIKRIQALVTNTLTPIRIVFSGPTENDNPSTNEMMLMLERIFADELKGSAVFLPNYNLAVAALMTSGTDVWLNTPMIGREACGTSGMKALLNGSLPLSTKDGWMAEAQVADIGWVVDEPDVAQKLLDAVEKDIIPLYYKHIVREENTPWLTHMAQGRALIQKDFSMSRAFKEYIEKYYVPLLHQHHAE